MISIKWAGKASAHFVILPHKKPIRLPLDDCGKRIGFSVLSHVLHKNQ